MNNSKINKLFNIIENNIEEYDALKDNLYTDCEKVCEYLRKVSDITKNSEYEYKNNTHYVSIRIDDDPYRNWVSVDPKKNRCYLWDLSPKEHKNFLELSPKILEIANKRLLEITDND